MRGVKNLDKVLKLMEGLDFPSEPEMDDFFNDDHLLGMQFLEVAITYLLRSRRCLTEDQKFDVMGKFTAYDVLLPVAEIIKNSGKEKEK